MPVPENPARRRRVLGTGLLLAGLMTAAVMAPTVASAAPATITHATLPSFFIDQEGTFFPATCDVTQVINDQQRIETFSCTFDDAVPEPFVCDKSCSWASDFDGAPAVKTHFLVTPQGVMRGWAIY